MGGLDSCVSLEGLQFLPKKKLYYEGFAVLGPRKLHYEEFTVLIHKKMFLSDNTSCWVFMDVWPWGVEHVKFPMCFYLYFTALICECAFAWR